MRDTSDQKISLKSRLSELGTGGTQFFSGLIKDSEHNADLQGLRGVATYDKMRRSDAQVQALLYAVSLPILSANWEVTEGTNASDQHIDFARKTLFERIDFQGFLQHALSSLWAGYSWFEKVYAIEDNQFVIHKVAPRLASTLYRWNVDESANLMSITQKVSALPEVVISRGKLVLFTFQQDANNYAGQSLLRGAWRHYFIKDMLYKVDAIRLERFGIGIPHIQLPKDFDSDDLEQAEKIGKNWRGGAQSYLVTPKEWTIDIVQMSDGKALDILSTIKHHDEQIAKAGLAQFLTLGQSETGSRALGEVSTQFLTDALEGMAAWISGVINRDLLVTVQSPRGVM